jgi:membrane-associated protein
MSVFLPILLNWLQAYGYVALWLTIFVAAAGIPLPIALLLLAAGAFASVGDFNIAMLGVIAMSAFVSGDTLGYVIGWRWGSALLDRLEHSTKLRLFSPRAIRRSRALFARHGGWAIFLTRFLFSGLGGVINLLAGADRYSYRRFLLWDIGGELLGVILPLLLGFLFSSAWEDIGELLGNTSIFFLILLIALVLSLYLLSFTRMRTSQPGKSRQRAARSPEAGGTFVPSLQSGVQQPLHNSRWKRARTGKLPP